MANLYDDFEKRFTNSWFSAGWIEVEAKPQQTSSRKDLTTLESELQEIEERIESITQNQLRLSNLAKMYTS